jgi:hypothetical protein
LIVVLGNGVAAMSESDVSELVRWLQLPGVGFATGRVVTDEGRLAHVGLVHRPSGEPLALYSGFPAAEPGYMAYTAVLRNVSAPHPWCFAFRREVWDAMGGLVTACAGPHAVLDLALRGLAAGWRSVYVPYAGFTVSDGERFAAPWLAGDVQAFADTWRAWLERGDPYYPVGMSLDRADMVLIDLPSGTGVVR